MSGKIGRIIARVLRNGTTWLYSQQNPSVIQKRKKVLQGGILSITFDDGFSSQLEAAQRLSESEIVGTFYIITYPPESENKHLTTEQMRDIVQMGHEIGSHTMFHRFLPWLCDSVLHPSLRISRDHLELQLGTSVTSFASPHGGYSCRVLRVSQHYYASHRSVIPGYNHAEVVDPYLLRSNTVIVSTPLEEIEGWIDNAVRKNLWLIINFHLIDESNSLYSYPPETFQALIALIKQKGIRTATIGEVINQLT